MWSANDESQFGRSDFAGHCSPRDGIRGIEEDWEFVSVHSWKMAPYSRQLMVEITDSDLRMNIARSICFLHCLNRV